MEDKFVTIAKYTDYLEADLAKQTLDDFEIESIVTGENVANMYGGLPAATDIELQVVESQVEQAREILQSEKKQEQ